MLTLGADRSGHVRGSLAAPRDDVGEMWPEREPRARSSYPAIDRMPGIGLAAGSGLDWLVVPSPPEVPAAQTTRTASATSAFSRPAITGSSAPHDSDSTRIGGQVVAGTPAPHGCRWLARTQAKATSR